jgi:hypothetical protein
MTPSQTTGKKESKAGGGPWLARRWQQERSHGELQEIGMEPGITSLAWGNTGDKFVSE